ncbi:sentrin-specific protease 6 isoform X2 [Clupea harengus]|uniref:Sentrin-specific protease 6 isoform X2 n=1 Tax=Clupea harengus TaxID=7950 RepID=A0A6P8GBI8_CLUHA|nr:sentrin-specific protease 6 isoform X2 [Clupea harengus]
MSQSIYLRSIHCGRETHSPRVIQGRLFHHTISPLPLQRTFERSDTQQTQEELCVISTSSPLCTAFLPSVGKRSPREVPDFGIFSSIPSFISKPSSPLLPPMALSARFEATLNTLPKISSPYFSASESKITLPRKLRMRDEFGDTVDWKPLVKKRKIQPHLRELTESLVKPEVNKVCLDITSWSQGGLHSVTATKRTVKFTQEQIEIDQCVHVQAAELTGCELCLDQKLPVIFLWTTPACSLRLQIRLKMLREKWAEWYDCGTSASPAEKYIVLMLGNLPSAQQQNVLEKILSGIGRANQLNEFPHKISLDEANNRLKTQVKAAQSPPVPLQSQEHTLNVLDTDEEDLLDARGNELEVIPIAFTDSVRRLLVYPPPPAKGGITVTNEDLRCLKEGEFLNDVIIDFYLKYLVSEKLKIEDAERTHIFSSFFFKHLTQGRWSRDRTSEKELLKKRRHDRVKTWTRHVDLFEKDFLFVPINKSAHWFLAIVCFPGCFQPDPKSWSPADTQADLSPEPAQSNWLETRFSWRIGQDFSHSANPLSLFYKPPVSTIGPAKGSTWPADLFSSDDEKDMEIESGLLEYKKTVPKPCNSKQPCILIMDSLGHGKATVVNILKEYLEEEWRVRKGTQRSFEMNGSSPLVPQQNNLSDCGVYLLQYVESFFESPLQSFKAPIDLSDWFPQKCVATKRKEIRQLILKIQNQQQMAGKAQDR